MSHPKRKQVTVHLPRAQAREVDDLIEREAISHVSRDEFVRDAVARRLDEIRANLRSALGPTAGQADSSFVAEPASATTRSDASSLAGLPPGSTKPRPGAVDDRSPAPGTLDPSAVGAEDDCVS